MSLTYIFRATDQLASHRVIYAIGGSPYVLEYDILKDDLRWVVLALAGVDGTIALINLNGEVVVVVDHQIVGDVANVPLATTTNPRRVTALDGLGTRPDLESCRRGRVGHGVVVDVQVRHDIVLVRVVAEGPDGDAMRSVALQALDNDVGAVGLERDAIVVMVDLRVLDYDVIRAECIPAVQVGGEVARSRAREDVDIRDEHVGTVGNQVVPLTNAFSMASSYQMIASVHLRWENAYT